MRKANLQRGFTLAEMAISLLIVGILFTLIIPPSIGMYATYRRAETQRKLNNVAIALNSFVVLNKRLPCPADATVASSSATYGTENRVVATGDCVSSQENGVVPWTTLGLALTDAQDAWENFLTYRVGYGLTRTSALDMTNCDPAGTADVDVVSVSPAVNVGLCQATCTGTFSAALCTSPQNFLVRKGLNIYANSNITSIIANYSLSTGAAYFLASHGNNSYGAIGINGVYRSIALFAIAGTTLEKPNRNLSTASAAAEGGGAVALTIPSTAPPMFIDTQFSDSTDATIYFDDIVIRPGLLSVIIKANLGPRSH